MSESQEIGSPIGPDEGVTFRLWDKVPDTIVHIAGGGINLFGRYLRQRCEWCGAILIDYDLARVMVPVGQDGTPSIWPVGSQVRVDGYMSAVIDNPQVHEDGSTQLPPDSCCFSPITQHEVQASMHEAFNAWFNSGQDVEPSLELLRKLRVFAQMPGLTGQ